MIYKRVILKRGKEESVKRFHPWIFSGAIARADKMEEGDLVTVPSWRPDVRCMADLAEEVGRFYGYDKLPTTMFSGAACSNHWPNVPNTPRASTICTACLTDSRRSKP